MTFVDALERHAHSRPAQVACRFLCDGEDDAETLTYAELRRRACAVASALAATVKPGARALLLYPPGLDYLGGFLGCLYAGVAAVPAYPPDPGRLARTLPRLRAVIADADPEVILTTAPLRALAQVFEEQAPEVRDIRWLATDTVDESLAAAWKRPDIGLDTVAFLQYTSGSTGSPKGVVVTQGNLVANERQISATYEFDAASDMVSWLPVYHDMGLIGALLEPLFTGATTTFMAPSEFLRRPVRWLRAISKYRPAVSGGPNFGYELCVRKVTAEEMHGLDLSSWRVAFNGSERVRPSTLERFNAAFAKVGLRPTALKPVYGLAEATLMVCGHRDGTPVVERLDGRALENERRAVRTAVVLPGSIAVAGCGIPVPGQVVAIVDPENHTRRPDGDIGEIWIRGDNIAHGYWQKTEQSARSFGAHTADGDGPFLRTGDLGYQRESTLFVTGRLRDLIIIRGRNFFPEDIEQAVERSHAVLRPGCAAAFSVDHDGQEVLVVAAEVERRFSERRSRDATPPPGSERRHGDRRHDDVDLQYTPEERARDLREVEDAVRRAVGEQFDLVVADVQLLVAGSIPKTSSGKVQRRACREAYLARTLETVTAT